MPLPGLVASEGDKGSRIAQRGFTGNTINGNIEGHEIIYHPQLKITFYSLLMIAWKQNTTYGLGDRTFRSVRFWILTEKILTKKKTIRR